MEKQRKWQSMLKEHDHHVKSGYGPGPVSRNHSFANDGLLQGISRRTGSVGGGNIGNALPEIRLSYDDLEPELVDDGRST